MTSPNNKTPSINTALRYGRLEVSLFLLLLIGTAIIVLSWGQRSSATPTTPTSSQPNSVEAMQYNLDGVNLSAQLSQSKLMQNGDGQVYMTLSITTPDQPHTEPSTTLTDTPTGTDLVIVLDRSGSMSSPEKLPYAKSAIHGLVSQLSQHDRVALLSFSGNTVIDFPLSEVNSRTANDISRALNNIHASGGTNISSAIDTGWNIIKGNPSHRISKVMLLSDGAATNGDTSLQGLVNRASQARVNEAMLSTIGMGLDFNESVMASLADHGMGNFSYLENLAQLGAILSKDLDDTRSTFANSSEVLITLPQGVQLVDASGYPFFPDKHSRTVNIKTGRLTSGATQQFMLTLNVPTHDLQTLDLSEIQLNYARNDHKGRFQLARGSIDLAVIEAERKEEVFASVDSESLISAWSGNNIGRMKAQMNDYIRQGKKQEAVDMINRYQQDLERTEAQSGVSLSKAAAPALDEMVAEVEDAFDGSAMEQEVKRKRLAKKNLAESRMEQRKVIVLAPNTAP